MATIYHSGFGTAGRTSRWQDWANLILAIWLFVSPWVLQFGAGAPSGAGGLEPVGMVSNAAWNAWVLGVLLFLVSLSALGGMEAWQEWLNLLFGAWIFAAPWALGFTRLGAASWDHWGTGIVVFLIAASGLAAARRMPGSTTAPRSIEPPLERPGVDRPPRGPLP